MLIYIDEVHPNYILGKTNQNIGYKLFTLTEDTYLPQQTYKVFTYTDVKLENNTIFTNYFAFKNRGVRDLFIFLISLKGIGTKGALNIILESGGSKNLTEMLYKAKTNSILKLPKKYPEILLEAISKKKNQDLLSYLSSSITEKSIRSEALWLLQEMDYERNKAINALDLVDKEYKEKGLKNGIEDLGLEETLREAIAILFKDK